MQLSEIREMIYKNTKLIIDYINSPEQEQAEKREYFKSLVKRTEMLMQCVKDVEGVAANNPE